MHWMSWMSDFPTGGCRVVLSADRTMMADYRTLLDGMLSAAQTTATPEPLLRVLLAPCVPSVRGRTVEITNNMAARITPTMTPMARSGAI